MQTGSRLGPRNRIRGQMYKAVRGHYDRLRSRFSRLFGNFQRFAEDKRAAQKNYKL